MSRLDSIFEEALKLSPEERRQLAARLLEERGAAQAAHGDERREAARGATDESFLADSATSAEDFQHADRDEQTA